MDSPTTPSAASPAKVLAALLSVYLVWGSTYLAIRVGLGSGNGVDGYPPFLMGGLRFVAASLVFYAFLRWRGHAAPTRAQWKNAAVLGLLMMLMGNGLVNLAETHVSSGLAAIAVASMPLWAGLFGALKGRHPSAGEWTGLVIGFAGVVWLNFGSEMSANLVSMAALILAPVSWAFGSVWSRDRDLPGPFMSTAAQMICGGVAMLVVGLALGERIHAMPPLQPTLAVMYLAVFGSIVGFTAYVWLLHHVRPALATSYAYVNPPIAVLLGALLLHEKVDAHVIGAMAVILVGVVIITRAKAR